MASAVTASSSKSPHVLAIPFPEQNQLIPFLEFSYRLAFHGISVTILTTRSHSPPLQHFLQRAKTEFLDIRPLYIPLPSDQKELQEDIPWKSVPLLVYSFRLLAEPIEQWIQQQKPRPVCIISDFYLGWTQKISAKLAIPRAVFHASSAFGACVDNSLWTHMPHLEVKTDDEYFIMPDLPLQIAFRRTQISRTARTFQRFDPVSEFMRENRLLNLQSWGILVNTFYDLELGHIDHLHTTTDKPVWPIGPILPPLDFNNSKDKPDPCFHWLDSQKPESVLYVCLGNHSALSEEQMMELACGLEAMDKPFMWANYSTTAIPKRFAEQVDQTGSGFIIRRRAPHHLILSHQSVGGFLTHCEWNSALQSIAVGVPMITWPISGAEFCNSMLVTELLKIGVQLCEGENGVPNREDLQRTVAQIMPEDCAGEERSKAKEIGELARTAMDERRGSSHQSLKAFADEIHELNLTSEHRNPSLSDEGWE